MRDYWIDLCFNEAWSKRERCNFIMAYIDEKLGETEEDET